MKHFRVREEHRGRGPKHIFSRRDAEDGYRLRGDNIFACKDISARSKRPDSLQRPESILDQKTAHSVRGVAGGSAGAPELSLNKRAHLSLSKTTQQQHDLLGKAKVKIVSQSSCGNNSVTGGESSLSATPKKRITTTRRFVSQDGNEQSLMRKSFNRSVDESDQRRLANQNRKSMTSSKEQSNREFQQPRERSSTRRGGGGGSGGGESESECEKQRRSINTQEGPPAKTSKVQSNQSPSPSFSLQQRQDLMKAYTFKLDRQLTIKFSNSQQPVGKGPLVQPLALAESVVTKAPPPPANIEIFHEQYTHLKGRSARLTRGHRVPDKHVLQAVQPNAAANFPQ